MSSEKGEEAEEVEEDDKDDWEKEWELETDLGLEKSVRLGFRDQFGIWENIGLGFR